MFGRLTISAKIIIFIVSLMIPIILIFSYSNYSSVRVVEKELKLSTQNRISFFMNQMERNTDQLSLMLMTLIKDPLMIDLLNPAIQSDNLNFINLKKSILDKLSLQSVTSNFSNNIVIYIPPIKQIISNYGNEQFNIATLQQDYTANWQLIGTGSNRSFIYYLVSPYPTRHHLKDANFVLKLSFPEENIRRMLDVLKQGNNGDPFMYSVGMKPIFTSTVNQERTAELMLILDKTSLQASGNFVTDLNKRTYLVNYIESSSLGMYLIDYSPMEDIISPIMKSRNIFYASLVGFVIVCFLAFVMLYRSVQTPIRTLILAVQRIKKGDYSVRIHANTRNEFGFLFLRFNEMAAETEDLIKVVYTEKIRTQEAVLKQLQSQINPHFLYNCLAFISSMAKLKENEAIVAMSQNLGKYYRYTTKLEKQNVTLTDEIKMVRSYLEIQSLRLQRIEYEIQLEQGLEFIEVPRLIIQPIVENAIVHGLESKEGIGHLSIVCSEVSGWVQIVIEDDGKGIDPNQLEEINRNVSDPYHEERNFGTWNVNQRLKLFFGEGASIIFKNRDQGGTTVILKWKHNPS
ncbi:MAG: histidine kinase [Gorillibacterium sp.]|nr:histidine kinase [Gorillibacterium sp.]